MSSGTKCFLKVIVLGEGEYNNDEEYIAISGEDRKLLDNSMEELLKMLPEKVYNCAPFGIQLMPCNSNEYSVSYYSHFEHKSDDRIPSMVANSWKEALAAMIVWMNDEGFLEYRSFIKHKLYERFSSLMNRYCEAYVTVHGIENWRIVNIDFIEEDNTVKFSGNYEEFPEIKYSIPMTIDEFEKTVNTLEEAASQLINS